MKILGLSFGKKGGNCDIALKQALVAAKEVGNAEVSYINTCHLKIDRCVGCGICSANRDKGGMSMCIFKDDFQFVAEAIAEADALIVAAPVYVLGAPGQYKNLVDRIGPAFDYSYLVLENSARKERGCGEDELIPAKYMKNRPLALIAVGGAVTKGWTNMGLATMHPLGFPLQMVPVDALNIHSMLTRVSPVRDDKLVERLKSMGRHVANCLGKKREEMSWNGDEGICPICHCDQLTVREGTTVECTICGSIGNLSVENGKIKVDYPEEQLLRARYRPAGDMEHCLEIKGYSAKAGDVFMANKDLIQERVAALDVIQEIKRPK